MRILVVEDELPIADFVCRGLESEGYAVEHASDGVEGERMAVAGDLDLVILDLMLPGRGGLTVLQGIRRAKPGLPVILLTARDGVADKVNGLDNGANDYVTKPFSFEELTARVRAHLRSPAQGESTVIEAAGVRLDLLGRQVRRDGETVNLTAREFELLAYLMRHPNQVLSRQQILNAVWDYDFDPGTNVVEVYVGYLRRKLARPDRPAPIETVRSVGYRFADR
jgi:DNA-binding response OmpR family regulator